MLQNVWIIDDDEIYRYGFRKLVTINSYCAHLVEFHNGHKAIDFLKDPRNRKDLPDAIFLDIEMPVMDGWEFLAVFGKIKSQLHKPIAIFMLTSSLNYYDIVRAHEHEDIASYMIKPINTRQFSSAFNYSKVSLIT